MNIDVYKENEQEAIYTKSSVINSVSKYFVNIFDQEIVAALLSNTDFELLLIQGTEFILQKDIGQLAEVITRLYHHFLTPKVDLTNFCQQITISQFAFFLFNYITNPEFSPLSKLFLELFIEVMAKDKEQTTIIYIVDHEGIEKANIIKNIYPELYPLVLIFLYNIYSISSLVLSKEQTNIICVVKDLIQVMRNEDWCFLSVLVLQNLLRDMQITDPDCNKIFFSSIIKTIDIDVSPDVTLGCFWCLYQWFTCSWQYSAPYINKSLLSLLVKNIESQSQDIASISLYVYSIVWAVEDENTKSLVEEKFPFDQIMILMNCPVEDISVYSLVNLNNFVIEKPSNLLFFIENDGMNLLLSNFSERCHKAKLEGSYFLTSLLSLIPRDKIGDFLIPDLAEILCDVCQLDELILTNRILYLCKELIPDFPEFFEMLNFFNFIEIIEANTNTDDITQSLLTRYMQLLPSNQEE